MKRNKFVVNIPKAFFWYMLCVVMLLAFLPILFTVFQGVQHMMLYISCVIIALPFTYLLLKLKLFKITVTDQKITVKKGIGRQYSFDVFEIVKVDWKIVDTKMGRNEKISVTTLSGKKVSIETLIVGFDKMSAYISENVDNSKVNIHTKKMK